MARISYCIKSEMLFAGNNMVFRWFYIEIAVLWCWLELGTLLSSNAVKT
jgi:hypothetical protein